VSAGEYKSLVVQEPERYVDKSVNAQIQKYHKQGVEQEELYETEYSGNKRRKCGPVQADHAQQRPGPGYWLGAGQE